jgi:hypothetical protein
LPNGFAEAHDEVCLKRFKFSKACARCS